MSDIGVNGLSVAYGEKIIFKGLDAEFEENKINVILGDSGIGKTTLLNVFAGLVPYSGEVKGAENGISYIFQNDRLIPSISVYKNLDMVLKSIYKDKNERRRRILKTLNMLEIEEHAGKLPVQLSGGQAQRAAMARALIFPGRLLLMDEPFRALDTALKARLISALVAVQRAEPRTIIFVTHAIDECLMCADRYFLLEGNPARVTYSGIPDAAEPPRSLADPALQKVRSELLGRLFG